MRLKTGTWIVVADGARGMVLVNEGTADAPVLKTLRIYNQDNPRTSDLGDDKPGRSFESTGARRSAMEAPDLHQKAEDRFVAGIMDDLAKDAAGEAFEAVVIAAPPVALGAMRKAAAEELSRKVASWIDKDFTKQPVPEIAKAVARVLEG